MKKYSVKFSIFVDDDFNNGNIKLAPGKCKGLCQILSIGTSENLRKVSRLLF